MLQLCGVQQLLDAALAGYNVTIFAYGELLYLGVGVGVGVGEGVGVGVGVGVGLGVHIDLVKCVGCWLGG